jgi:predicted alpha/beta-fold hydrolase
MRAIDRVRVPPLVITAEDDPLVPSESVRDPKIMGNPHIDLRLSAHGRHCGFVGEEAPTDDGYQVENQIVEFIARQGKGAIIDDIDERLRSRFRFGM